MNDIYYDEIDKQIFESGNHLNLLKSIIDQSKYTSNQYHQQLHYKSIVQFLNHSLNHCKHLLSFTQTLKDKKNFTKNNLLSDNENIDDDNDDTSVTSENRNDIIIQKELMKQLTTTTSNNTTDLKDAQDTEITAIQISELLTAFESKVEEQGELMNMFENNIEQANDCMDLANDELRKLNNQDDKNLPFPYNILPNYISHFIKYFISYLFIMLGLIIFIYDRIKL